MTKTLTPDRPPAFLSRASLAAELDMSESMLDDFVNRGVLPKPVSRSPDTWRWTEVVAAMESGRRFGTIYVIGFGPYVKIGFTSSPLEVRMAYLQTGCPEKLKVYAEIDGEIKDETALHRRFAPWRTHGEWYRKQGPLAQWIKDGCP